MKGLAAALIALLLLGACDLETDTKKEKRAKPAESSEEEPESPSTPADIAPNPDGTYDSSCTYALGDFTESKSGYRFLADANLKNTGNVGLRANVSAVWFLAGGDKVKEEKVVKVAYGKRKRIGFSRVATQDELSRHQDYDLSNSKSCRVSVSILGFYGEAYP